MGRYVLAAVFFFVRCPAFNHGNECYYSRSSTSLQTRPLIHSSTFLIQPSTLLLAKKDMVRIHIRTFYVRTLGKNFTTSVLPYISLNRWLKQCFDDSNHICCPLRASFYRYTQILASSFGCDAWTGNVLPLGPGRR